MGVRGDCWAVRAYSDSLTHSRTHSLVWCIAHRSTGALILIILVVIWNVSVFLKKNEASPVSVWTRSFGGKKLHLSARAIFVGEKTRKEYTNLYKTKAKRTLGK